MKCPKCQSNRTIKNGHRRGKQCYKCHDCGRQYVESPVIRSYPLEVKQLCLKMYLNGMGLRGIERVTEIHHTTIMDWVRQAGLKLPDAPEESEIPEITEIDELQTFIGNKRNKIWVWTIVNYWKPGIILWTVGDRSSSSFHTLWLIIKCWHSFCYVTDGWKVYPGFIAPEDHLVCKTYMTRVEGENTRLRHYLARLHRKTLCYSKSLDMLKCPIRFLLHYLKFHTVETIF
ncbi:IS1 family transposase [Pleurocapsa sp. FMAR1]|uniref:IS1 family transposase n=1 Tax=Pleurocapsa sp. FMAR1 TaxID=3040204 RepID=UPI0029C68E3A|nr:IS1 family transposase [Pleurocapsa sp. FMAR1]